MIYKNLYQNHRPTAAVGLWSKLKVLKYFIMYFMWLAPHETDGCLKSVTPKSYFLHHKPCKGKLGGGVGILIRGNLRKQVNFYNKLVSNTKSTYIHVCLNRLTKIRITLGSYIWQELNRALHRSYNHALPDHKSLADTFASYLSGKIESTIPQNIDTFCVTGTDVAIPSFVNFKPISKEEVEKTNPILTIETLHIRSLALVHC